MNCFEARREFAAFWQRRMSAGDREAFLAHLRQCPRCEHSFRLFALSAPVLHSAVQPESSARAQRSASLHSVATNARRPGFSVRPNRRQRPRWRAAAAGFAMAAVAVVAVYVATTPRATFEDALTAYTASGVQTTSYTPTSDVFGPEVIGEDPTASDPLLQEPPANLQNELAG